MDTYVTDDFWRSSEVVVFRNALRWNDDIGLDDFVVSESGLSGHLLFSTSGSSGSAKWVALSRRALLHSARSVCDYFSIDSNDVLAVVLPLFHVGGFSLLARSYLSGAMAVQWNDSWNASSVLHWLEQNKVTVTSMVPAQLVDLCSAGLKAPRGLRALVIGGGALPDDVLESARALGWPVYLSYGQTEAASQLATGEGKWLSILSGVETRLNDDGCLEWRSEAAFSGYVQKIDESWHYFPREREEWVVTQDRVELQNRELLFVRRADRVIKILGELVDVNQLELELGEESAREVKIICLPHHRRGALLVPVVEGTAVTFEERSGVERLEPCFIVPQFPRSELGKIRLPDLELTVLKLRA